MPVKIDSHHSALVSQHLLHDLDVCAAGIEVAENPRIVCPLVDIVRYRTTPHRPRQHPVPSQGFAGWRYHGWDQSQGASHQPGRTLDWLLTWGRSSVCDPCVRDSDLWTCPGSLTTAHNLLEGLGEVDGLNIGRRPSDLGWSDPLILISDHEQVEEVRTDGADTAFQIANPRFPRLPGGLHRPTALEQHAPELAAEFLVECLAFKWRLFGRLRYASCHSRFGNV